MNVRTAGWSYVRVTVAPPWSLPESRIVTRELLYTGVTRARTKVTIVGPWEVIAAAITTPIRRATGLASRLQAPPNADVAARTGWGARASVSSR
ncbi:MAG: hypothetical protein EBX36_05940 [Planctomycetia bacterium]|nr:hypothetical protein [Planctomycetia bacterium]